MAEISADSLHNLNITEYMLLININLFIQNEILV